MIRANKKCASASTVIVEKDNYIQLDRNNNTLTKGTISSSSLTTNGDNVSLIIGVDGYDTVTFNDASQIALGAFNDADDVQSLTPSASPVTITGYKYILVDTGSIRTLTFA